MPHYQKIALALDLPCEKEISELLNSLQPQPTVLKVGLEVCNALGTDNVIELVTTLCPESKLFLDLKLHDIPNTVQRTVQTIKLRYEHKVQFLTVHALGGGHMLKLSVEAAGQINVAAVTLLTTHSKQSLQADFQLPSSVDISDLVLQLARTARNNGIEWLVCSPNEIALLKKALPGIKLITPGIRSYRLSATDDQARIATLQQAFEEGSDLVVIGRPIYQAPNPQKAWTELIQGIV